MAEAEVKESAVGLMDPASPEFATMLADMKSRSTSAEAPTDDKKDTPASSAEEGKEKQDTTKTEVKSEKAEAKAEAKEEKAETDPGKLQAQVNGLKAELKRVREQRQNPEELAKLNEKIANLQGRLEQLSKHPAEKAAPTYTDEQLIGMQTDWQEVLADAKAKDDADRTAQAKHQLSLINKELHQRAIDGGQAKGQATTERDGLVQEATSLYEEALTLFPDLNDKESELWKAANTEYTKRPRFMKALGPYADAIAVSMAIAKNPKLIGTGDEAKAGKEARKQLLDTIEKTADKALLKGSGSATSTQKFDFSTATATDVQAIADRIKRGEAVSL